MASPAQAVPASVEEVFYPSADGEPIAETPLHLAAIILLLEALQDFLAAQIDTYIGADMFWYWEEGNPLARRAPDVMVVKGVGRGVRRSFFSWREGGAVPCFIVEMAAESTWRENLYEKHRLYASLGVREYFIFDPEGAYIRPPLLGFRLDAGGAYVPLEPDQQERLQSEELGLYLRAEGAMLRLADGSGEPVLTREEEIRRLRALLDQASQGRRGSAQAE